MLGFRQFAADRWDLGEGTIVVWDVRDIDILSVQARKHFNSPNAWNKTVNYGWSDDPAGFNPTLIGTLAAAGSTSAPNLDVSSFAYLVFYPSTLTTVVEQLDLKGTSTARSSWSP